MKSTPIIIGGVGGSGTRVVAAILKDSGVYIGDVLNKALDNDWFTLLFWFQDILDIPEKDFDTRLEIFQTAMTGTRPLNKSEIRLVKHLSMAKRLKFQQSADHYTILANSLISHKARNHPNNWGWKAPYTHLIINRLVKRIPGIKYIHVVRNGVDMALSKNQYQLLIWGEKLIGNSFSVNPRNSLKFWRRSHERIEKIGASMGNQFLMVGFENLCLNPITEIVKIYRFANISFNSHRLENAIKLISTPSSIGRAMNASPDIFDASDLEYAQTFRT
jgi:hypothetical protein